MSATRDRQPRKATAARISYTEPASSSEDDGGDESVKPTRKAIKKRGKGMARADIETGVDDGYDDSDRPPAKARKPGKGRCANMAATVRSFGALPVELVIMILSYLDTPELLAFSKVDKQHRALMTSATMRDVWITAREKHDLPALSVGEFTEWQYAELVFGRKCFDCRKRKTALPDLFLRARLCPECRQARNLVRSDELHEYVDLHPKTADCVLASYSRPSGHGLLCPGFHRYVPLDWALEESERLWAVEVAATASSSRKQMSVVNDRVVPIGASARRSTRQVSGLALYNDELPPALRQYVADRMDFIEEFETETSELMLAFRDFVERTSQTKIEAKQKARETGFARRANIKQRVLSLDIGFVDDDFQGAFVRSAYANKPVTLTDDEWVDLKPKILKLIQPHRVERLLVARQQSLRKRYDGLKQALSKSSRLLMPLFVDFLALPSVKELWLSDTVTEVTDAAWEASLADVSEELAQYRLDLVVHARDLIQQIAGRDTPEEPDDVLLGCTIDLDDALFTALPHFLVCTFSSKLCAPQDSRTELSVGTLSDVLYHLHDVHDTPKLSASKEVPASPQFRFSSSKAVQAAMHKVLELAKLDPETASKQDILSFARTHHLKYSVEGWYGSTYTFAKRLSCLNLLEYIHRMRRHEPWHLHATRISAHLTSSLQWTTSSWHVPCSTNVAVGWYSEVEDADDNADEGRP